MVSAIENKDKRKRGKMGPSGRKRSMKTSLLCTAKEAVSSAPTVEVRHQIEQKRQFGADTMKQEELENNFLLACIHNYSGIYREFTVKATYLI